MDIIKRALACKWNKIMNHNEMIYQNCWVKYKRSMHSSKDEKVKMKDILRGFFCNDTSSFDNGYNERHARNCQ
jgi:hypothetical protein